MPTKSKTKVTSQTKIIVGVAVAVLTAVTLFILYQLAYPNADGGGMWKWLT